MYDEDVYPNASAINRALEFYYNYLAFKYKNWNIEFDIDAEGGIAIMFYSYYYTDSIWISFMNTGFDSIVFSIAGRIKSYPLNKESINKMQGFLKEPPSFIYGLFQKIKSLFALTDIKK